MLLPAMGLEPKTLLVPNCLNPLLREVIYLDLFAFLPPDDANQTIWCVGASFALKRLLGSIRATTQMQSRTDDPFTTAFTERKPCRQLFFVSLLINLCVFWALEPHRWYSVGERKWAKVHVTGDFGPEEKLIRRYYTAQPTYAATEYQ